MRIQEFIGNAGLASLLAQAPLPQSSLFEGPAGVGKKTLALSLAALANCRQPLEGDLCGVCNSCVKVFSGNHPDVILVDRAWLEPLLASKKKRFNPQVVPIDAARELVKEAQYRPFEGKMRVFIIDDAEKMNESASNALLKTLEEPAETLRIILVSAYPNQLLPTIRSRCQRFAFGRLSRADIQTWLERSMDADRAALLASFSQGSIGSALSLDLEAVLKDRETLLRLLSGWLRKRSFANLHAELETPPLRSDLRNRERASHLLELLQLIGYDLYFLLVGTPERTVNHDRLDQLFDMAGLISLEWLEAFLYHVREAQRDIHRYVNPLLCFETLWLMSEENAAASNRQI